MLPDEPLLPVEASPLARTRGSRAQRARRTGRIRRSAAIVLVCGLAAGWFATTRIGRTSAQAATPDVTVPPPATAGTFVRSDGLRRLLPAGAQCHDQDRRVAGTHCSVAGVDVVYRLMLPAAVQAAYLAAVGSGPTTRGRPACARGGEEERAWSRPAAPGRAAGRYACRVEQGRAAMWWTVADRGLLAHATAVDSDLTSLFAWWEAHSER